MGRTRVAPREYDDVREGANIQENRCAVVESSHALSARQNAALERAAEKDRYVPMLISLRMLVLTYGRKLRAVQSLLNAGWENVSRMELSARRATGHSGMTRATRHNHKAVSKETALLVAWSNELWRLLASSANARIVARHNSSGDDHLSPKFNKATFTVHHARAWYGILLKCALEKHKTVDGCYKSDPTLTPLLSKRRFLLFTDNVGIAALMPLAEEDAATHPKKGPDYLAALLAENWDKWFLWGTEGAFDESAIGASSTNVHDVLKAIFCSPRKPCGPWVHIFYTLAMAMAGTTLPVVRKLFPVTSRNSGGATDFFLRALKALPADEPIHLVADAAFGTRAIWQYALAERPTFELTISANTAWDAEWVILFDALHDRSSRMVIDPSGVLWMAARNGGRFALKSNAFVVSGVSPRIQTGNKLSAFANLSVARQFLLIGNSNRGALNLIATQASVSTGA